MTKIITSLDIKKALSEGLQEKLTKNRQVGAQAAPAVQSTPAPQAAPAPQQATVVPQGQTGAETNAAKVGSDKKWKPYPAYATYVNNPEVKGRAYQGSFLEVGLQGIAPQHHSAVLSALSGALSFAMPWDNPTMLTKSKAGDDENVRILEVYIPSDPQHIREFFTGGMDAVVAKLRDMSGKSMMGRGPAVYEDGALNSLKRYTISIASSAPSQDEIEMCEMKMEQTYKDLFTKLTDPSIIAQLKRMGGVYFDSSDIAGKSGLAQNAHQWSDENKLRIISQLPYATYVMEKWAWTSFANRTVNADAPFALAVFPFHKPRANAQTMNQAARACHFNNYDEYKAAKKAGSLSTWQIHAFDIMAELLNPQAPTSFIHKKVYDVKDTTLIAGMEDVWMDKVNYQDNLLGVPNAAAVQAANAAAQDNGEEADLTAGSVDPMDDDLAIIFDAVQIAASRLGKKIKTSANGDISDNVARAVFEYGLIYLEKFTNLVKADLAEGPAAVLSKAVMLSMGIDSVWADSKYQAVAHTDAKTIEDNVKTIWSAYSELIPILQAQLRIQRKTAAAQAAAKLDNTNKVTAAPLQATGTDGGVVSEEAPVGNEQHIQIQPMSYQDMLGLIPTDGAMIQESFFNLLDKITLL